MVSAAAGCGGGPSAESMPGDARALAVAPDFAGTLWAAPGRPYRTQDGGRSWTRVPSAPEGAGVAFTESTRIWSGRRAARSRRLRRQPAAPLDPYAGVVRVRRVAVPQDQPAVRAGRGRRYVGERQRGPHLVAAAGGRACPAAASRWPRCATWSPSRTSCTSPAEPTASGRRRRRRVVPPGGRHPRRALGGDDHRRPDARAGRRRRHLPVDRPRQDLPAGVDAVRPPPSPSILATGAWPTPRRAGGCCARPTRRPGALEQ